MQAFRCRSWVILLLCAIQWLGCGRVGAQGLRVESFSLEATGWPSAVLPSETNAYYLMLRGNTPTSITRTVAMGLGTPDRVSLVDRQPTSKAAFYRVLKLEIGSPLDSDRDGLDDVLELRAFPGQDPLNPADGGRLTTFASSPGAGEDGVAVTRETILRFSRPLAAGFHPNLDQVNADFGGRRILSRLELSSDRRTLTLFYLENLPGGARIRVRINGDAIPDLAGEKVDADRDGLPGGRGEFIFETLGLGTVAGTAVIGRVFAAEPSLVPGGGGVVINRPLGGVTITVDGLEETARTTTDALGNFTLAPVPAGEFFVHIDGRTSPQSRWPEGDYYPVVGKAWTAIAGRSDNPAGGSGEVYLPLIPGGTLQGVSATDDTPVSFPSVVLDQNPGLSGVSITVPANALFSDNGTRGGKVGIAPVPSDRLPGPLPPGLELPLVITIQTDGPSNFDQPVPVRFPNLPDPGTGKRLEPGAKSGLVSFNHDTGQWEMVGPMTVTADGMFVESDPGYGLLQPGWHGWWPFCSGGGGGNPSGGGGGGADGDPPPVKCELLIPCPSKAPFVLDTKTRFREVLVDDGQNSTEWTNKFPTLGLCQDPGSKNWRVQFPRFELAGIITLCTNCYLDPSPSAGNISAGNWCHVVACLGGYLGGGAGEWQPFETSRTHEHTHRDHDYPEILRPLLEKARAQIETESRPCKMNRADAERELMASANKILERVMEEFEEARTKRIKDHNCQRTDEPYRRGQGVNDQAIAAIRAFAQQNRWTEAACQPLGPCKRACFNPECNRQPACAGAPPPPSQADNTTPSASLESIVLLPQSVILDPGRSLQLRVLGLDGDGRTTDVTPGSAGTRYSITDETVARISPDGEIQALAPGVTGVVVSNRRGRGDVHSPIRTLLVRVRGPSDRDLDDLSDDWEVENGLNPSDPGDAYADGDQDSLDNLGEYLRGTDPNRPDTDGDRASDGEEIIAGTDPLDPRHSVPEFSKGRHFFALMNLDTGEVVLRGETERNGRAHRQLFLVPHTRYRHWILSAATLKVGTSDFRTLGAGFHVELPATFIYPDIASDGDGDGLTDQAEFVLGTRTDHPDSDQDGASDLVELEQGTNPLGLQSSRTGVLSSLGLPGDAMDVQVRSDRAVLALGPAGVAVCNTLPGLSPTLIALVDTPGNARRVACSESWIAVADDGNGLVLIDAEDPTAPHVKHHIAFGARVQAVAVAGARAFAGLDDGRVVGVDMPTGAVLAVTNLASGIHDLGVAGGVLFVITSESLFSLSSGADLLARLSSSALSLNQLADGIIRSKRLSVGDGRAYVTSYAGFDAFDVSDPRSLTRVGMVRPHGPNSFKQIVPNGSGLGVAASGNNPNPNDGSHHVSLYDLADPAATDRFVIALPTPGVAKAVSLHRGLAYVADGLAGLQVVNYLAADVAGQAPTLQLSVASGTSVEEGKMIVLQVNVRDDVQARNVEFFVDEQRIGDAGSAPFEFTFVAPRLTVGNPSLKVRARAFDTGGNFRWSDERTVVLLPDITPPRIIGTSPSAGASMGDGQSVAAFFGEPMSPGSFNADNVKVVSNGPDGRPGTPDDAVVPNGVLRYDAQAAAIRLSFKTGLPRGDYRFLIGQSVSDQAGNALGMPHVVPFSSGLGLTADSFAALDFSGPQLTEIHPEVNLTRPANVALSVRWRGSLLIPSSGPYGLSLQSAGRARLWLDGRLLMENWLDHTSQADTNSTALEAGEHPLQVEFSMPATGAGLITLRWSGPGFTNEIVPAANLRPYRDTIPPFLLLPSGESSFTHIRVRFSEPMDEVTAEDPTHYSLDRGARVLRAVLQPGDTEVVLETTRLEPGTSYTLTVSGTRDASEQGNIILPGTSVRFHNLITGSGWLRREVFLGAGAAGNSTLSQFLSDPRYPFRPDMVSFVRTSEAPVNGVQQFFSDFFGSGQRLVGWFQPPVSGDYSFWVSGGKESDLILSTDDSPSNGRIVAHTPGHGPTRWIWQNNLTGPIRLEAGRRYYLEGRNKFFGTDEHFAISASYFGQSNLVVETEDYDFGGGQHLAMADSTPYYGGGYSNRVGVSGVDYSYPGPPNPSGYRPDDDRVDLRASSDVSRGTYSVSNDFSLRMALGTNRWFNYTRLFQPGRYRVYARLDWYELEQVITLDEVVGGRGTPSQALGRRGEFRLIGARPPVFPPSVMVPLRDGQGQSVILDLTGLHTHRLTSAGSFGANRVNCLVFVPVPDLPPELTFFDMPPRTAAGPLPGRFFGTYTAPDGANLTQWDVYTLPAIANGAVSNLTQNFKYPSSPDKSTLWTHTETSTAFHRFGQRISGFLIPPLTGEYILHLSSDDQGELWLSTDENPLNAVLIAREPAWNGYRDWSGVERRQPDAPENRSAPLRLEAGRRYWFEALGVDVGFGDYLGLTWRLPAGLQPGRESAPLREGLVALLAGPQPLTLTRHPSSASVPSGTRATFSVRAKGIPPLHVQWFKDGVAIKDANGWDYTTPVLSGPEAAGRFKATIESLNEALTSEEANLTIQ